ncbi:MAG: hypothetical protein EAZ80_01570 [Runella slithyformis]|nr:MAG: hypothetical protein EAZ80_01570 [Runella slithyformis]TAF48681.1 MAG: hypothetical protein EAZ63_03785 [Runella slithyformis]
MVFVAAIASLETCKQINQTNQTLHQDVNVATKKALQEQFRRRNELIRELDSVRRIQDQAAQRVDAMSVFELQSTIDSLYPNR